MLNKKGFRINELESQMGFIFKWKQIGGVLEIGNWKKVYEQN